MSLLFCTLAFAATAPFDTWLPPYSRIFASEDGKAGVEVLVSKAKYDEVTFHAFTFEDAERRTRWSKRLNYVPHKVFVGPGGDVVVTMDMWGRVGYDHSVVVYGSDGRVVKDFKLEDLLSAEEISSKVMSTVSSRWWSSGSVQGFIDDGKAFEIKLEWGKTLRIDTRTGEIATRGG